MLFGFSCKGTIRDLGIIITTITYLVGFHQGGDSVIIVYRKMRKYVKMGFVDKVLEILNYIGYVGERSSVNDYNVLFYCYVKFGNVVLDKLV